jgi:Spx/MgsR family transcriptional regulator
MAYTLYGISNCDTVRKARRWLDAAQVEYRFHDVRQDGLAANVVESWLASRDWETVVNRRSTSWKALSEAERQGMDDDHALQAILQSPTLIKRPVLVGDDVLEFGFSTARYEALLA